MERRYLIGAGMTLILIIVIILLIYSSVPNFNEEVKKIADDVFGSVRKQEILAQKEKEKKSALEVMKTFADVYSLAYKGNVGCILNERIHPLPENYWIKFDGRFLYLFLEDGELVDKIDLANRDYIGSDAEKLKFGLTIKDDFDPERFFFLSFQLSYDDGKFVVTRGVKHEETSRLLLNTFRVYKPSKDSLVLITDASSGDLKYWSKKPSCKSLSTEEKKAKTMFNNFVSLYKNCRKRVSKVTKGCVCDGFNLNLSYPYSISAKQFLVSGDSKSLSPYVEFYLEKEGGILVEKEGLEKTELKGLRDRFFFSEYDFKSKRKIEGKIFMFIPKDHNSNRVYIAEENYFKSELKNIEDCKSIKQNPIPLESSCTSFKNIDLMIKRIKTTKYNSKTYEDYIREGVENLNEKLQLNSNDLKLLTAAIMIQESEVINNRVSPTGCKGLMQFCSGTALGFKVDKCDESDCFVCSIKGCSTKDQRDIPSVAIPAGVKLINRKIAFFSSYKNKELFGVAAYNGGEGIIRDAINATGESDPSWDKVKKSLTKDIFKKYKVYSKWTDKQINRKINEIKCYVAYVMKYKAELKNKLFKESFK